MKTLRDFVLLAIILTVSSGFAIAQEAGGLKGKVRTTKGEGIASAVITVRQNGDDVKSVTADSDGNFTLENLKAGVYNLVFTKSGYSSGVMYNVEVKKNKVTGLSDRLILMIDQGTQVIIKGSVFAPDGRSIGGAEIKIEKILGDDSLKKVGSAVSSYSGEFTFRFPEGAAKYKITATNKGSSASKEIEVSSAAIYRLALNLDK